MQEINGHATAMGQAAAHQDDTNADMEMIRRDLDEVSSPHRPCGAVRRRPRSRTCPR